MQVSALQKEKTISSNRKILKAVCRFAVLCGV